MVKPTQKMANAAKRALKAREKAPDSKKCCTRTGLARANQLAKRENLSVETLERMRDFLTRHKSDLDAGTDINENKGAQSIAMWGSPPNKEDVDSTIKWIDGKLNSLKS